MKLINKSLGHREIPPDAIDFPCFYKLTENREWDIKAAGDLVPPWAAYHPYIKNSNEHKSLYTLRLWHGQRNWLLIVRFINRARIERKCINQGGLML
ncbi:hypothetical protein [Salicibibacter kimchii]|uniref:Uncharacterized protein n=1 Tax=Salicibibacter kimchii TaxID=2099786 RepID=A0A345BXA9_9BACI|nr:hypothetical protein [Salicibibacter kimchii]AXF55590.1 hypothetical protein DT065_05855 [Salicibibacter kimchii]